MAKNDDSPICGTCGGVKVPKKNSKGCWFVGCPTCPPGAKGGKPAPAAKKTTKEHEPPAPHKKEEKGGSDGGFVKWLDSFMD